MAESGIHELPVEKRVRNGTAEARRLRNEGMVPGIIYGHKQDPVMIKARTTVITPMVTSGHQVVEATFDGTAETALIQEVQWDTFGKFIQHFDLLRVDATETVTVDVPIEMKGDSPGMLAGGVLNQQMYSITLECPAIQIPDYVVVRMTELQIGDEVRVSQLPLPVGAKAAATTDDVVLQILDPVALEQAAEAAEAAEAAAVAPVDEEETEGETPAAEDDGPDR